MAVNRRTIRQGGFVISFVIVLTLLGHITNNSIISSWKSSETLKNEIRELSIQYVKQVIIEKSEAGDSPYAPKESANLDMSKSMAVVLDILLKRTAMLEEQLSKVTNCTTNSSVIDTGSNKTHIKQ